MIKLYFTINVRNIDTRKYSELFAIDKSLCPYFHSKKNNAIAVVLGNDFFKKYNVSFPEKS